MTDITNVVVKANRLFTGGPVCVGVMCMSIYMSLCVCVLYLPCTISSISALALPMVF